MDIEQIQEAASRKLEENRNVRVTSVTEYAEAAKRVADLRAQLKMAERRHLAAHRAAVRLGWTEADLKGFGIESPTLSVGGRPRKPKGSPSQPPSEHVNESVMIHS